MKPLSLQLDCNNFMADFFNFFWIITPNYTPSKKLKKLFFNSSYRPKIPLNLQNGECGRETHKSNMPCPWISRGAFFQFGLQSHVDWGASQTALFQGKLIHQFSYLSFFFFCKLRFSEKATKILEIFLIVLVLTK